MSKRSLRILAAIGLVFVLVVIAFLALYHPSGNVQVVKPVSTVSQRLTSTVQQTPVTMDASCKATDVSGLHIILAPKGFSRTFHVNKGVEIYVVADKVTASDSGDQKTITRSGKGIYDVGLYGVSTQYH